MHECNFQLVANDDHWLVIRDIGPWDKFKTITNGADRLVPWLYSEGLLKPLKQLFYFDSDNTCDEIVHAEGQFVRFAPGPR